MVAILGVLVALLLPAVQNVRAAAARVACQNNLKQVALACRDFKSANGALPPAGRPVGVKNSGDISWPVILLPHLEQEPLWRQTLDAYRAEPKCWLAPPHAGVVTVIKTYACPSDDRLGAPLTDDLGYTAAYGSYEGVGGGAEQFDGAMRDPTASNSPR